MSERINIRVEESRVVIRSEGIRGPTGPAGGANAHPHVQVTPADVWFIQHGFSHEPIVSITDSAGSLMLADVQHPEAGLTLIKFGRPMTGRARLI